MLIKFERLTVRRTMLYSGCCFYALIRSYIESRKTKSNLHATSVGRLDEATR